MAPAHEAAIASLGGGAPLPAAAREAFESRVGEPLGAVRLHSDARAGALASALHANALTVGRDIVFAPGRLQPGSADGRRLLAHELTHVIQNTATGAHVIRREPALSGPITDPAADAETEAARKRAAGQLEEATAEKAEHEYPVISLLDAIVQDLRHRERLSARARLETRLKGTEAASFWALGAAAAYPLGHFGGLGYRSGTSGMDTYSKTYETLTQLTPSLGMWTDPISAIIGVDIEGYFASDTFQQRLAEHPGSVVLIGSIAQGVLSAITEGTSQPTPDAGGFVDEKVTAHLALVTGVLGLILKKKFLTAPTTFNVGRVLAPDHPAYAHDTYWGGNIPSGVTVDAKKGAKGVGEQQHFAATVSNPLGAGFFDYEHRVPTPETARYGAVPDRRVRGGWLLAGELSFLMEAAGHFSGRDAALLTSHFITSGIAYVPPGSGPVKNVGVKMTAMTMSPEDSLAPTDATGKRFGVQATRLTPFISLDIPIEARDSVKLDGSAGIRIVTGRPAGVSDFSGRIVVTHVGSGTSALPDLKVEVGMSMDALDWFNEMSPKLWGVLTKAQAGRFFIGAQLNTGAGAVSRDRAAELFAPSTENPGQLAPSGTAFHFILGTTELPFP